MLHPLPFTMFDLSKGGNIGGVQDIGNNAMFTASVHNNRFDRNHYILGTNDKSCFWWNENDGGKPNVGFRTSATFPASGTSFQLSPGSCLLSG